MSIGRRELSQSRASHRGLSPQEEHILNQIFGNSSQAHLSESKRSSTRNTPIRGISPRQDTRQRRKPPVKPVRKSPSSTSNLRSTLTKYEEMIALISNIASPSRNPQSQDVVAELQASPRTLEQAASEQTEIFYKVSLSILQEIKDIKARVIKVEEELDELGV